MSSLRDKDSLSISPKTPRENYVASPKEEEEELSGDFQGLRNHLHNAEFDALHSLLLGVLPIFPYATNVFCVLLPTHPFLALRQPFSLILTILSDQLENCHRHFDLFFLELLGATQVQQGEKAQGYLRCRIQGEREAHLE